MAILKNKEIKNMDPKEREKKIKELKLELVKSKANAAKSGAGKIKEIKRTIARMLTFNKSQSQEPKQRPAKKEELKKK